VNGWKFERFGVLRIKGVAAKTGAVSLVEKA
jgi:hypothetical protein